MTELEYDKEPAISSVASQTQVSIVKRKTIVYQTLVDPTIIRIAAEKNKHKFFAKYLLQIDDPAEIEFISIEKYYEPYLVVSGAYQIDYYRKCAYTVKVDTDVREVVLLDKTFVPTPAPNPKLMEQSIWLPGEERLTKEKRAFLLLDRWGRDSNSTALPTGPSENNSEELVDMLGLPEVPANLEVDAARCRIWQRPTDTNRIVSELFEITERALVYAPRFNVTFQSKKIEKEICLEFDGVTSKLLTPKQTTISLMASAIVINARRLFRRGKVFMKSFLRRLQNSQDAH